MTGFTVLLLDSFADPLSFRAHEARFGAGFSFQCSASEGAILTLPDGASMEDYRGIARFRDYASQNAESWYKYVNGPRHREAENGSIYLITGCDKSKSWGVASFANVSGSFRLTFIPTPVRGGNENHTFSWVNGSLASTNSGPVPIEYCDGDRPQNQCTFIRGFKISLSEGLWATLWGRMARVSTIVDARPDDILSRSSFVPFLSGGSWLGGLFSGSGSQGSRGNGQASEEPASDEIGAFAPGGGVIMASDFPPTSYVRTTSAPAHLTPTQFYFEQPYHPSNIINEHLLKEVPSPSLSSRSY